MICTEYVAMGKALEAVTHVSLTEGALLCAVALIIQVIGHEDALVSVRFEEELQELQQAGVLALLDRDELFYSVRWLLTDAELLEPGYDG